MKIILFLDREHEDFYYNLIALFYSIKKLAYIARPVTIENKTAFENTSESRITVDGLMPLDEATKELEKILLERSMKLGGTIYKVAALLGMSQPTFFRKYKAISISKIDKLGWN